VTPLFVGIGLLLVLASPAGAQVFSQRGFVDAQGVFYTQEAPNDPVQAVGDLLAREEVFLKPSDWVQFAGGLDFRANSHDQVEDDWRLDYSDRGVLRPRLSVRRASATFSRAGFTLDVGKQFIRWGKTDIVAPTDRFGARDFLNVFDAQFLAVSGVRAQYAFGHETLDAVWIPRFTPSRVPLLDQRWTVVPPAAAGIPLVDTTSTLPRGAGGGVRWSHVGDGFECALSFFDGLNSFPSVESRPGAGQVDVSRLYPSIRTYGGDVAVPSRWFTIKGEAAYFTTTSSFADEYVLYVVQLERQQGEWMFIGGYSGQVVTVNSGVPSFDPDRGLAKSIVGRASYTVDVNRSIAFEAAVQQAGHGAYGKVEYSQAYGQHWRATAAAVLLTGDQTDFYGQYSHNSNAKVSLRYSF